MMVRPPATLAPAREDRVNRQLAIQVDPPPRFAWERRATACHPLPRRVGSRLHALFVAASDV
jgi:hypothetical protein